MAVGGKTTSILATTRRLASSMTRQQASAAVAAMPEQPSPASMTNFTAGLPQVQGAGEHLTSSPKPFPLQLEYQRVSASCRMVRAVDPASDYATPFIPLVDFGAFMSLTREGSSAAKQEVVEAVTHAYSEGQGFMLVEGTDIEEALVQRVLNSAHAFFGQDMETKDRFRTPKGDLGYVIPTRDRDMILQEYLNVGYPIADPAAADQDPYFSSKIGRMFFQHTDAASYAEELEARWPDAEVMARNDNAGHNVRAATEAYEKEMCRFSETMWTVFSSALGLPTGTLADMSRRHISHLQLNHYPKQPQAPSGDKMRIRAHFDVNAFTILRNDESGHERGHGNLQVLTREGLWKDMPIVPNAFVCNVGQLMERWTNAKWKSVVHRVTNPVFDPENPAPARITLGYFAFPDYDAHIDCLPGFMPDDAQDKVHEGMTCGEHSRIGRRLGQEWYDPQRTAALRVAQDLYAEDELEK